DPDTGEARWFYQWGPHDLWDYDGVNELLLLDLPVDGPGTRPRKVIVRPERDGHIYVLDRATGQVLSATPYGHITTTLGVDLKAGRPILAPDKAPAVGAVVTAGDVVFYGTMDRWFKAVDARTGQLLWQFQTGSGIIGQPITYRGPDGKQYVAVFDGVGGWAGAVVAGALDPRDSLAALG